LDGRQVHYFAQSVKAVERSLQDLDDNTHYVYGTALPVLDRPALYVDRIAPLTTSEVLRKARLEGKLDMFLRRVGALRRHALEAEPLVLTRMSLETVSLALKVIALLDGVPFDPRKRLMETSLVGPLGQRLMRPVVAALFCVSAWKSGIANREFLSRARRLELRLKAAACKAGYAVGLPQPDRRAEE